MNPLVGYLTGMSTLTDQVVATDMLISTKASIRSLAVAATESATPAVKATLIKQLHEAIDTHAKLTDYMVAKGYYHPYQLSEQLHLDRRTADTALRVSD